MGVLQTIFPLKYRTFISLEQGNFVIQKPRSETPLRNRSYFCDLRLRCPSRTPEIAMISETRESNAALRFKGAMESR